MQKMPVKKIEVFAVGAGAVAIAALIFAFAFPRTVPADSTQNKLKVVATLFPFYDFARQIGGDMADVSLLLPPGVEAHSFDPRPSDLVKINRAGVFVFTGKFMEPWAADLASSLPKNVSVVDASAGIELQPAVFGDADEPAGAPDPHIWLDFGNDKTIVESITKAMAEKDPANAGRYRANAAEYLQKLADLDAKFKEGLSDCASHDLIYGGHYALGYLARRYGLQYAAAQGVSPDAEPTAQDLASLVGQIRRDKIPFVFYEELSSPKIAQTVADETGAKLLLLNAAHNVGRGDLERGATFIDIMENDLANLKTGLRCQPKN